MARVEPDRADRMAGPEADVGDPLDVPEVGVVAALQLLAGEKALGPRRARRDRQPDVGRDGALDHAAAVERGAVGRAAPGALRPGVGGVQDRRQLAAVADREAAGEERHPAREVAVDEAQSFLFALLGAERAVDLEAVDKELVLVVGPAADRVGIRQLVVGCHAQLGLGRPERVVAEGRGNRADRARVDRADTHLASRPAPPPAPRRPRERPHGAGHRTSSVRPRRTTTVSVTVSYPM